MAKFRSVNPRRPLPFIGSANQILCKQKGERVYTPRDGITGKYSNGHNGGLQTVQRRRAVRKPPFTMPIGDAGIPVESPPPSKMVFFRADRRGVLYIQPVCLNSSKWTGPGPCCYTDRPEFFGLRPPHQSTEQKGPTASSSFTIFSSPPPSPFPRSLS